MVFIDENRAAVEWNTSREQVVRWCTQDLVPGAELSDGGWLIPRATAKPQDEAHDGSPSQEVAHGQTETGHQRKMAGQPLARPSQKGQRVAKPFLKWAGGKKQILGQIRARYPEGLGKNLDRYAEPFVGSGAVLFDVLSHYSLSDVYISDINRELVTCYTMVRDRVEEVVTILGNIEKEYLPGTLSDRKQFYSKARDRFNSLRNEITDGTEIASLFIFLNHTCFNGLYRVNSNGEFNVPMGRYKNPTICDARNLRAVSQALAGVTIAWAEYSQSSEFINSQTFVYIDPPYRPLSPTSFTSYFKDSFGDSQQAELARFVDAIVDKGAYVLVSNSDPKNTEPMDNFFDELYVKHTIDRIKAVRIINSVASGRGAITELLIVGNKNTQNT